MNDFERSWRIKIYQNTSKYGSRKAFDDILPIFNNDYVDYSKELITTLKSDLTDDKVATIFCKSACHMPHSKLKEVKELYHKTKSIHKARVALEQLFKNDIKKYKKMSDEQLDDVISKGWGAAGIMQGDDIIATKIPSMFHEYFAETDTKKKKFYYCHCPRVRKELLQNSELDSIYCNCGGGFYQDIWEYITNKEVKIDVQKNLFDGDDVCQFKIQIGS